MIDAHIHYVGDHPEALALLERLDLKLLNVAVAHREDDPWRRGAEAFRDLADRYPEHYAWCTTFDPPGEVVWAGPAEAQRYADRVTAGLTRDFEAGSVACKFWKNIGMQIRKASGEFLMIDDPIFDPIYEYLASVGKPALMHIGEPLACWQPLDESNVHAGYYSAHPEWYMGDKPAYPSHAALIAARDRVLARHPRLRVIGAHLGSLEYDVAEVADRLQRYPNFAVDTSARLPDLARQDRGAVRALFLAHPDRILYGTDVVQRVPVSSLLEADRDVHLASLEARYARELDYLGKDANGRGLSLPPEVFGRVVDANAAAWYPGL